MDTIVIPRGERLSRPPGEFNISPAGFLLIYVETVEHTRRIRLRMLVDKYAGLANLCEELGYSRKETSGLSRILNANLRHDRAGEPYNMGSPMARSIEHRLELPTGWMDTPPDYFELHRDQHIADVIRVMEDLPEDWQREKVASIVLTLVRPKPELELLALDEHPIHPPTPAPDSAQSQKLLDDMRRMAHAKNLLRQPITRKGKSDAA